MQDHVYVKHRHKKKLNKVFTVSLSATNLFNMVKENQVNVRKGLRFQEIMEGRREREDVDVVAGG